MNPVRYSSPAKTHISGVNVDPRHGDVGLTPDINLFICACLPAGYCHI